MLGVASRGAVRFSEAGLQGEAGAEGRSSRSIRRWSEVKVPRGLRYRYPAGSWSRGSGAQEEGSGLERSRESE